MVRRLLGLLQNRAAFQAESRLPMVAWRTLVRRLVALPATATADRVKLVVKKSFEKRILRGPIARPRPAFLERVGNARVAIDAARKKGVGAGAATDDWGEFQDLVAAGDLPEIKALFGNLLIARRPVWAVPFASLAARPLAGIGIADLCQRLALGRTPRIDGQDWVFCYALPPDVPCKVPTIADACGGGNWHEPYFPAPAGRTLGRTKPTLPKFRRLGFFEVVHDDILWYHLAALPENRAP